MSDYPDLSKKKTSLETPSLRLAYLQQGQAKTIYEAWASDFMVTRYLTWYPHKEVHDTEKLLNHWLREYEDPLTERFGLYKKEGGELIGMIDVVQYDKKDRCPHIGYVLKRSEWNKGYMSEALGVFTDYLFSLGYPLVYIEAVDQNIGSNRVICKNGYRLIRSVVKPLSPVKKDTIITRNEYVKEGPNFR